MPLEWTLETTLAQAWPMGCAVTPSGRLIVSSWGEYKIEYTDNIATDDVCVWTESASSAYYSAAVFVTAAGTVLVSKAANYGVLRSVDNGVSYSNITSAGDYTHHFFQASSGRIFGSQYDDVGYPSKPKFIYSDDDGLTWTGKNPFSFSVSSMVQTETGRIVAAPYRLNQTGTPYGAYSDDNGNTWTTFVFQDPESPTDGINNILLMGSDNRIVCQHIYSDDNGLTWKKSAYDLTPLNGYSGQHGKEMVRLDNGIFALVSGDYTYHGGLYLSTDNGASWEIESSLPFVDQTLPCLQNIGDDLIVFKYNGASASSFVEPPYIACAISVTEGADSCYVSTIAPTYGIDFIDATLGSENFPNVIEQYKQSARLKTIISTSLAQKNELQRHAFMLYHYQYLANAFGYTLDMIGATFNVPRGTLNDSEYRAAILRRAANRGQITPNDLLRILKGFYGATMARYLGAADGKVLLATRPTIESALIEEVIGAGIGVYAYDPDSLCDVDVTEGADVCAAVGVVSATVVAAIAITEGADIFAAEVSGVTEIDCTMDVTEGADTVAVTTIETYYILSTNGDIMLDADGDQMRQY